MKACSNYIDGRFVEPRGAAAIEVINPANQKVIATAPDSSADDVGEAVAAAKRAQPAWERLSASERAGYLRKISQKIRENVDRLANTISKEQGKILPLALHEVNLTANYMDYMAEWALRIEGEIVASDNPNETILLFRKAIGVTAGILPWNFPFFLIARKLAPALVTGNTIVVKSSEETPINAFEFAELVDQTDIPKGVINIISGRGATTGSALSAHRDVGLVSFTGSVATGAAIMAAAASNLTRVNLELGGKAPAIVLKDADIDVAVRAIHESRIANTGQLCNCPERIYVERSILDEFTQKVSALMATTTFGDPLGGQDLMMGPLVNRQGLQKVASLVESAKASGAEVVTGGDVARAHAGFHFEPTVLLNCTSDMEIMRKEIFGPVLPIQAIDGLEEGIALANDSEYGLTSSIFSTNLNAVMKATRELRFGETFVNRNNFEAIQGFHAGRRKSGIGGADGKHGLHEFMETHIVYIES